MYVHGHTMHIYIYNVCIWTYFTQIMHNTLSFRTVQV